MSSQVRKTVLLLDASNAMNSNCDFLPTRLLALRNPLCNAVRHYFEERPFALMAVVVLRDGVAHCVAPLTNCADEIVRRLDERYFLVSGSGAVSLDNGLKVGLSLLSLRACDTFSTNEMILISACVFVCDAGDVFQTIRCVKSRRIRCSAVSLSGAVNVIQSLCTDTGGQLYCPMDHGGLCCLLTQCFDCPAVLDAGLPTSSIRVGFVDNTTGKQCPRCGAIAASVPCACSVCGLLLSTVSVACAAALAASRPPQYASKPLPVAESPCTLCGAQMGERFYECVVCHGALCRSCSEYASSAARMCPLCVCAPPGKNADRVHTGSL